MSTFKMLLYGETGTGKTTCTRTLIDAGFEVRFLAAESNAISGITNALEQWEKTKGKKVPEGQFGMMIPARPKKRLADMVKSQGDFIGKSLESQLKAADPKRKDYTRYLEVLKSTVQFVDNRSAKDYGSVDDWGEDTVLVVDGLTIICEAIQQSVLGGKLATSQPEWGVMQKLLVEFLRQLTEDIGCNLVILAHPNKEIDPLLGAQKIYPSSIGQALNNLLPTFFTEVVYSVREKGKFYWCTDHRLAVTRTTVLPIVEKLEQDFKPFSK